MKKQDRIRVLVQAFSRLTNAQRARLRRHVQMGTPILCHPNLFVLNGVG
jgi:hypothetical protein